MSHLHAPAVSRWLTAPNGILDRRSAPKRLRDEAAQAAEIEMMTRAIANAIPSDTSGDRLPAAFSAAEYTIDTSGLTVWPTIKELLDALRPHLPRPARRTEPTGMDDAAIDARRIRASEAVAESSLYGERAMAMIRRGLLTEADLEPYRRGAWSNRAEVYGEAEANRWREEAEHRHRLARDGNQHSPRILPTPTVKRMAPSPEEEPV